MAKDSDQSSSSVGSKADETKRKLILVGVGLLVAVVAWLIGAAVIPRWWAQRVANVVDGRLAFGSLFGLTIGFVFTLVPLIVLRLGWRFRESLREGGFRRALLFVAVAAVAAFPNLATLGIVWGSGSGARAGDRILDVDGPGYRGGSLVGAIVAVVAAVGAVYLIRSRQASRAQARKLAQELKDSS